MKNRTVRPNGEEPLTKRRHWREGLLETMEDPTSKIREDERVTAIRDKYPKARQHYLVLPKDEKIHSPADLRPEHEDLLRHMENVGRAIAKEQDEYEFVIGYHAVPSMSRLHLHVVSTDFDSPCLKTKYHWNSFTTPFFRTSESIREELKEHGRIKQMSDSEKDKHLKKELVCHKCTHRPKNMPELKKHLLTHLKILDDEKFKTTMSSVKTAGPSRACAGATRQTLRMRTLGVTTGGMPE